MLYQYPHAIPVLYVLKDKFSGTFPPPKKKTQHLDTFLGGWASTGASALGASYVKGIRGFQPGHQTYYQVTR